MAIPMKVTLSPERISLSPAESADIEVTVQNASQVVEHFTASVVGLPSNDLWSCEPDVVKLRPKEVGTLRVRIQVPERGGLVAGPYILGVVVKSPYSQEVSRCEELPLDVQPAPQLTMGVQPEVANGAKIGHFVINLANEGNMPMAVTLSGSDPESRVGFKFSPRELRLEPGTAAGAQVTVNSDQPLTGQEARRTATLKAHAGDTVVEKPVTFVQRPKIGGGWKKFGAIAAGLAILGGMSYGGAKLLRDLKPQNVAQTQAAQPPVAPNPNDPNKNANANQSNQPNPPPNSNQPTPPPNSNQPTQPANPSASANPGVPPNAQPVPVSNAPIDFTVDPRTQQPAAQGTVPPDRWRDKGITLQNVPENASAVCKDATDQVIRVVPNDPRAGQFAGLGRFLTSARPLVGDACNVVPVRILFERGVTAINLQYTGLPNIKYVAQFKFDDGTSKDVDAIPVAKTGDVAVVSQKADQGPKIVSVTFAHAKDVKDGQDSAVMLKGVGFTMP